MTVVQRAPRPAPAELKAKWGRNAETGDAIQYAWGGDGAAKTDAMALAEHLEPLAEELAERGFDITTLRFSIRSRRTEEGQ